MKLSDCEIVGIAPDELKCIVCTNVLDVPVQCENGHMYCSKCNHKTNCKTGITVPNIVHKMLDEINVKCPLKCEWTEQFKFVNLHIRHGCPNRIEPCLYCDESFQFKDRDMHDEICAGKHVQCNFCNSATCREDLEYHKKYCTANPARVVQCVCGTDVAATEQAAHITADIGVHFMAFQSILEASSTCSFAWKFKLSNNAFKQSSGLHHFAGIDWYLFYPVQNEE
jgi:hypothetical protein